MQRTVLCVYINNSVRSHNYMCKMEVDRCCLFADGEPEISDLTKEVVGWDARPV